MSNALEMAVFFHETYERLAPSFGYATREDTKQFDPSSNNGRLMQAVCAAWLEQRDARIRELERWVKEMTRKRDDEAAARIRELAQWKQAIIDGLMVAEIYQEKHDVDPKAALNALIDWHVWVTVRELNEKIAEHEKVCAGVWVPVTERLPEDGQEVETLQIDTGRRSKANAFFTDGVTHEWLNEPFEGDWTHWIDVKEQQR